MVADKEYMKLALDLAQKAKGMTSPNPMVGCIIVKKLEKATTKKQAEATLKS